MRINSSSRVAVKKLLLHDVPVSGGVYSIKCLVNGRIYIGAAASLYRRAMLHRSLLHIGVHHNLSLRSDYREYGPDQFVFAVLACIDDVDDRMAFEANAIASTRPHKRYNLVRKSGIHNPGKSYRGRTDAPTRQVVIKNGEVFTRHVLITEQNLSTRSWNCTPHSSLKETNRSSMK